MGHDKDECATCGGVGFLWFKDSLLPWSQSRQERGDPELACHSCAFSIRPCESCRPHSYSKWVNIRGKSLIAARDNEMPVSSYRLNRTIVTMDKVCPIAELEVEVVTPVSEMVVINEFCPFEKSNVSALDKEFDERVARAKLECNVHFYSVQAKTKKLNMKWIPEVDAGLERAAERLKTFADEYLAGLNVFPDSQRIPPYDLSKEVDEGIVRWDSLSGMQSDTLKDSNIVPFCQGTHLPDTDDIFSEIMRDLNGSSSSDSSGCARSCDGCPDEGSCDPAAKPEQLSLPWERCECGAEKLGIGPFATGHSSWCPVFKKGE